MFNLEAALISLLFSVLLMLVVWALHLKDEDASIVDPVWGPAIVGVGLVYGLAVGAPFRGAQLLTLLVAGAWALRLGLHLSHRHRLTGEDRRYRKMREARGDEWWWRSVYVVFLTQAVLAWVVALPLMAAISGPVSLSAIGWAGLAVAIAGFLFEAVADGQLAAFKRRESDLESSSRDSGGLDSPSDNKESGSGSHPSAYERGVMDRGLWRYSRHPNYFGESVVWWGIGAVAVSQGAYWGLLGPALITFMLLKVSGVTMTEEDIADRRPAYREYVKATSAFIPRRPSTPNLSQD
ncbi:MAG: steroid 5-alpha reductase family enzyme [Planctomycetota bacterium]|jgi:steroid 5-alpha reductase family enzyme